MLHLHCYVMLMFLLTQIIYSNRGGAKITRNGYVAVFTSLASSLFLK